MTKLEVAALYAGLNILILLFLAARVPLMRRRLRVSLGDGGHFELQRAVRAHGNAAEYVPAGVAALLFLALLDAVALQTVHVLGAGFTAGRALHAWGLSVQAPNAGPPPGRFIGMVLTFAAYAGFAAALLWGAVAATL
ncbi:MAG: MAPEG family protein [Hyphomonadaceae bacterium]